MRTLFRLVFAALLVVRIPIFAALVLIGMLLLWMRTMFGLIFAALLVVRISIVTAFVLVRMLLSLLTLEGLAFLLLVVYPVVAAFVLVWVLLSLLAFEWLLLTFVFVVIIPILATFLGLVILLPAVRTFLLFLLATMFLGIQIRPRMIQYSRLIAAEASEGGENSAHLIIIAPIAAFLLLGVIPIRAMRFGLACVFVVVPSPLTAVLLLGWGGSSKDSGSGCQGQKRDDSFEVHDEDWLWFKEKMLG